MRLLITLLLLAPSVFAAQPDAFTRAQISPQNFVGILQSNQRAKILVLYVGPRVLYAQAHVPSAEYIGPASDPRGIQRLRDRVKTVPKTKQVIIYCGCCPWDRCPNVHPAFMELRKLGFRNVKVLHIANNFGADWVDKDHPVERGQ